MEETLAKECPSPFDTACNLVEPLETQGFRMVEQASEDLIHRMQDVFHADVGAVVFVVKTTDQGPLDGWRPAWYHNTRSQMTNLLLKKLLTLLRWVPGKDLPEANGFNFTRADARRLGISDYPPGIQRKVIQTLGVQERLFVSCPLNDDTVLLVLLDRRRPEIYDERDLQVGVALARRLRPLARLWFTQLGLTDGVALTKRERSVQACLARGLSEQDGAEELGLQPSSFHQVVVRLYRKRGVGHRGELLARLVAPKLGNPNAVPYLDVVR